MRSCKTKAKARLTFFDYVVLALFALGLLTAFEFGKAIARAEMRRQPVQNIPYLPDERPKYWM